MCWQYEARSSTWFTVCSVGLPGISLRRANSLAYAHYFTAFFFFKAFLVAKSRTFWALISTDRCMIAAVFCCIAKFLARRSFHRRSFYGRSFDRGLRCPAGSKQT